MTPHLLKVNFVSSSERSSTRFLRPLLELGEGEAAQGNRERGPISSPRAGPENFVHRRPDYRRAGSGGAGQVLILDDITEISKIQVLSAWREVARRVAQNEIKNRLTPIQLSAQRLEKLVTDSSAAATVRECAATIVEHVDSIKRLANEFSRFARMPTAEFSPASLNEVCERSPRPVS